MKKILLTVVTFVFISFHSVALTAAEKINLNRADAEVLDEQLKFVGETLAKRIVKYREQHGEFKSIDELTNVKGVGKRVIEANRNSIDIK